MRKAQTIQYRHEYKFRISAFDRLQLLSMLGAVMKPDPHVGSDGKYHIRSLYFDDLQDTALREKLDGVSRREKFRIRYYNEDTSFIRLEKKVKIGGVGTKLSAPVQKEEVERILAGDIDWMAEDGRDLLRELYIRMRYGTMKPKTIVEYEREPFLYEAGNVRVTIDSHVRSGLFRTDFFDPSLPLVETAGGVVILEVKYDNFLPQVIQQVLSPVCRLEGAFSKYASCRSLTWL